MTQSIDALSGRLNVRLSSNKRSSHDLILGGTSTTHRFFWHKAFYLKFLVNNKF